MKLTLDELKKKREEYEKSQWNVASVKDLFDAYETIDMLVEKASALTVELSDLILEEWADEGIGYTNSQVIKGKRDALLTALSGNNAVTLRQAATSLILYRERNDPLQLEKLDDYIRQLKEAL